MTRTVFYVWWATADENQNGRHHRSEPLANEKEAQKLANLKWKCCFVSIDKVQEVYEGYEWQQQDGTETERIEINYVL